MLSPEATLLAIYLAFHLIFSSVITVMASKDMKIANFVISSGVALLLGSLITLNEFTFVILANLVGAEVPSMSVSWVSFIAGIILLVVGCYLRKDLKSRIFVLNMYGHTPRDINDKAFMERLRIAEYKLKEQVININPILEIGEINEQTNRIICELIKAEALKFTNRTEGKICYFTGMASIPYTVLTGTHLARANVVKYYEFDRHNGEIFYELKNKKWYMPKCFWNKHPWAKLTINFPPVSDSTRSEIVLAISISAKIQEIDLRQFDGLDIVHIGLEVPRDNIIEKNSQLIEYKNVINDCLDFELREKYPNLSTIHLVAAIPSCVSIELGKCIEMGKNRFANIAIYHYVASSTPRYKFGLWLNGARKENLVGY